MRNLFLLVLLLNIILFAWQYTHPVRQDTSFVAADPGVEKLILLSELEVVAQDGGEVAATDADHHDDAADQEREAQQEQTEQPRQVVVSEEGQDRKISSDSMESGEAVQARAEEVERQPEAVTRCFRMGAFSSPEKTELAAKILVHAGLKPGTESQTVTEQRYWVVLPTQPDLGIARGVVQELKEKGVRDLQVLSMEGKKNAISLGLYKVKAIADLRMAQIRELGYQPKMEVIPRSRQVYWLGYQLDGDKSLSDNVINEIARIQEVSREERACK